MVNLGFVCSEFNYDLTYMMLERAKEHAKFLGVEVKEVKRVPGSFDFPLAVKNMLKKSEIDAVVTLGCVITGETKHDEIVAQHFEHLKKLNQTGKVMMAGRFTDVLFGLVMLEVESKEEAEQIMHEDPAVKANVFYAELYPWRVALRPK